MAKLMHSSLEDLVKGFFVRPVEFGIDRFNQFSAPTIVLDVKEDAEGYIVRAELPGVKKQNIKVDINGKYLTIAAEKRQEISADKEEKILYSECFYGHVARTLELNQEMDEVKSSAYFSDGILTLQLPKKRSAARHQLVIK